MQHTPPMGSLWKAQGSQCEGLEACKERDAIMCPMEKVSSAKIMVVAQACPPKIALYAHAKNNRREGLKMGEDMPKGDSPRKSKGGGGCGVGGGGIWRGAGSLPRRLAVPSPPAASSSPASSRPRPATPAPLRNRGMPTRPIVGALGEASRRIHRALDGVREHRGVGSSWKRLLGNMVARGQLQIGEAGLGPGGLGLGEAKGCRREVQGKVKPGQSTSRIHGRRW